MDAIGKIALYIVGGIALLALLYGVLRWEFSWLRQGNLTGLYWLVPVSSILYAGATASGIKVHYPSIAYFGLVAGFVALQAAILAASHSTRNKRKAIS